MGVENQVNLNGAEMKKKKKKPYSAIFYYDEAGPNEHYVANLVNASKARNGGVFRQTCLVFRQGRGRERRGWRGSRVTWATSNRVSRGPRRSSEKEIYGDCADCDE
eukprot:TRINITY_DN1481_c0_g2_i1.p4 TRINITY_DN1481_c0_g2~~TRINITY_DN1481_c0_g2_i1.p4  ORF type:complete len:106 (-),score=11.27 TRINITY_DN1481_c0_g2_i1:897-1214(-)